MFSARRIAEAAGITEATVSKRKNEISKFAIHKDGPYTFYSADAISHFKKFKRKKTQKGWTQKKKILVEILESNGITRPLPYNRNGAWYWNGVNLGKNINKAQEKLLTILKNKS